MNKSLILALGIIGIVVVVVLYNSDNITLNLIFKSIKTRASLVFLGFFATGLVTGLLLKGQ